MSDEDFTICVLNNLTEDYDVDLDGMETRLMLQENDPNKLTIEDVHDKLSGRYDRIREQIANHKDGPITDKIGMAAYPNSKQYKGICGKCGEYASQQECTHNKRDGFKFQVGNNTSGATT